MSQKPSREEILAGMSARARKRPKELEFQIQRAFVELVRLHVRVCPVLGLAYHPPNGGQRPAIINKKGKRVSVAGGKLKAMGARKDVPDWHLPVARRGYHGLWIEFKVPGGKPTPEQWRYHELLREQGHLVAVYDDVERAWRQVRWYLEIPGQVLEQLSG